MSWSVISVIVSISLVAVYILDYARKNNKLNYGGMTLEIIATDRWNKKGSNVLLAYRAACMCLFWFIVYEMLTISSSSLYCGIVNGAKTCYKYSGWRRFTTFTTWQWLLIGLYFHLVFAATIMVKAVKLGASTKLSKFSSFFMWVLFQSTFSLALMVCVIVEFVLVKSLQNRIKIYAQNDDDGTDFEAGIPENAQRGLKIFYTRPSFVMHNINVVMMLLELMITSKVYRFNIFHVSFPIIFIGIPYFGFAYYWHSITGVYYYFFIDHTKDIAWLGILGVLTLVVAFFLCGKLLSSLLKPSSKRKTS